MAAVTVSGMLELEAAALAAGWTEERLLDLAGERLGRAIGRFFPKPGTVVGYLGKGHNAGDTLVALRVLRDHFGWRIALRAGFDFKNCVPLTQKKWLELGGDLSLENPPAWRDLDGPLLLLDGLLGIGAKGALRTPLPALSEEMNWLRQNAGARVAAVDLPSGVDADEGHSSAGAVTADVTFMIGNPKRGLLAAHAADFTGALALVPVEVLASEAAGDLELIAPQTMDTGKAHRPFDFHKGRAGRVSIVAGSLEYSGAAVLAATGALRGGAGLVTLHVPVSAAACISAKCPPEIIVRSYSSALDVLAADCDALVIGCGIGTPDEAFAAALLELIVKSPAPCVLDADALNLIARAGAHGILDERHVLTPHPGEFRRLAPDLAKLPRETAARLFTERFSSTLLLKGCRTIVTKEGSALWCNSTGSPGMATGGQGDLLAGVIGACLASGIAPLEAASFSAWLCGRAAEIALQAPHVSEESLTPGEIAALLGGAFLDWRSSHR
jgi:ADP-dependent NAD(P)H-hydrate dehydratase / NAD(P)H-hydrate epimerase